MEEPLSNKVTIKDLVKDSLSDFTGYRDGELWYKSTSNTALGRVTFEFPVPTQDTGSGLFYANMKSITLMRWIRKHYEKVQKGEFTAHLKLASPIGRKQDGIKFDR